jgi:hypothetical protein
MTDKPLTDVQRRNGPPNAFDKLVRRDALRSLAKVDAIRRFAPGLGVVVDSLGAQMEDILARVEKIEAAHAAIHRSPGRAVPPPALTADDVLNRMRIASPEERAEILSKLSRGG